MSQQQLCDATFRDKPSITRLVDNLEKLKLVKRNASKEDRRKNLIVLKNGKNVSPEGCRDMVGNAWELTLSPAPGGGVVVRGGSWFDFALYAKRYFRSSARVDARNGTIGFRCVRRPSVRTDAPRAVVEGEVEPFVGQQVQEVLGFEGGLEDDLDLGCGLFDGHEGVDPLARHHVNDGEHDPLRTGEVGGVVLDEKSYTVNGNTSFNTKAEKGSNSTEVEYQVSSIKCDEISISILGIGATMKRN